MMDTVRSEAGSTWASLSPFGICGAHSKIFECARSAGALPERTILLKSERSYHPVSLRTVSSWLTS